MQSLSIILPIYNVEDYLRQCFDSILIDNQFEGEIVCVNDGSTDSSLAICNAYAEKYANIKIISQLNGGLSKARNEGVKNASGDYLMFIDSDDYLLPNVINGLVQDINSLIPDVICCNISYKDNSQEFPNNINIPSGIQGIDFVKHMYAQYHYGYPVQVWHYVCNRNFLLDNNLWNKEGFLHEDEDFTPRLLLAAKRVIFHPEPILFHRVQRPGSITTSNIEKRTIHKLIIVEDLLTFFDSYPQKVDDIFYEMLYALTIDSIVDAQKLKISDWVRFRTLLPKMAKNLNCKRSAELSKWNVTLAKDYFYGNIPIYKRKCINLFLQHIR